MSTFLKSISRVAFILAYAAGTTGAVLAGPQSLSQPGSASSDKAKESVVLMARGYQLLSNGQPVPAVQTLSTAVMRNPSNSKARRYLAMALIRAGNPRAAIQQVEALNRYGDVDPHDPFTLGQAYSLAGDQDKAIEHLNRAQLVESTRDTARCALVRCYIEEGDLRRAKKMAEAVLKTCTDANLRQWAQSQLSDIEQRLAEEPAPEPTTNNETDAKG